MGGAALSSQSSQSSQSSLAPPSSYLLQTKAPHFLHWEKLCHVQHLPTLRHYFSGHTNSQNLFLSPDSFGVN
jgi:hypothetical protein